MTSNNIILIPSTNASSPIGGVLNNFFVISSITETLGSEVVVWDFSNVESIHPFLAVSLSLYAHVSEKKIELINKRKQIEKHLDAICFSNILNLSYIDDASSIANRYEACKYIPVCSFDAADDEIQQKLQAVIQKQCGVEGLTIPLSYIMGELICNIAQHSGKDKVYLYSEYTGEDETINICIADTGIGIYGSYVRADKYLSAIGDNDASALLIANKGYSTKNLPAAENRGFGISTSRNMLVDGLGGSFYVISGSGLQVSEPNKSSVFMELPDNVEWQGTMIFLKIPRVARAGFNYTDYLQ